MFGTSKKTSAVAFRGITAKVEPAPAWLQSGSKRAVVVSLRPPRIPSGLEVWSEPEKPFTMAPLERVPESIAEAVVSERAASEPPRKVDTVIDELIPRADEEAIQAIRSAVAELVEARRTLLQQNEADMVKLVQTIARRVLSRELLMDPSVVQKLVKEGVAALAATDSVTVRIGPFFAEVRDQVEAAVRRTGVQVHVHVDPAVGRYGCRIETQWGSVDESVEGRLGTLLDALSLAPPPLTR
jgi:flagellar biosynthesis/type III secretory pathway protein FliH